MVKNKRKSVRHYLLCEAPICNDDPNPRYKKEVVWYPSELVCRRKPFEKFQKIQMEINKLAKEGKFKNIDKPYTAKELEDGLI